MRISFDVLHVRHEARKEASLINPATGGYLEVDLWIPELNLYFEFQVCVLG
jgi:hypothetical protein